MILEVWDSREAVELSRQLVAICNDIKMAFVGNEIKAQSYENFLCRLRDNITVRDESKEIKFYDDYSEVIAFAQHSEDDVTCINNFPKSTPVEKIIEWAEKSKVCGGLHIVCQEPRLKEDDVSPYA